MGYWADSHKVDDVHAASVSPESHTHNAKTVLAIIELLAQLLKQILMVHPTVIAVFYSDSELSH